MTEVADLYVTLRGNATSLNRSLNEAGVAAGRADSRIAGVVRASRTMALGTATAVVAVAGLGVKMAMDFNKSMEMIHTQAGATQQEVDSLKSKVLALAGQTAQAPKALADALFHVESVGFRGANAMLVLANAAKLATISGANLDDVTYGLTSIMNSYGAKANEAAHYAAFFNAVVGAGDMRMQDFAASVGTGFFSAAQTFGVSMQSAGAALVFLTDRGMRADEASTRLRMTLALMGAPTAKAAKLLTAIGMSGEEVKAHTSAMTDALTKAGLSTVSLSEDMKKPNGIYVALKDLKDHLEASGLGASAAAALISRAFGGGRSNAAIEALLNNLGTLQTKYKVIGDSTKNFGEAWSATKKQFSTQVAQLKATVESWLIQLGEKLIPVLSKVIAAVMNVVTWFGHHKKAAQELGNVIKTFLIGALAVAAGFLAEMAVEALIAAAPFIALSFAIGALAEYLVKLYKHDAKFKAFVDHIVQWFKIEAPKAVRFLQDTFREFQQVVSDVITAVTGFYEDHKAEIDKAFGQVAGVLKSLWQTFKSAFDAVRAVVTVAVRIIENLWKRFGEHLLQHLKTAWNAIVQIVRGVLEVIKGIFDIFAGIFTGNWSKVWHGISEVFGGVWNVIVGVVKFAINQTSTVIGAGLAVISAVWGFTWHAIKTLFVNIWHGINTAARTIWGFFESMATRVNTAFVGAGKWLYTAGRNIVVGLWNGIAGRMGLIWSWAGNLPVALSNVLGQLYNWMLVIGKNIVTGIWNGIASSAGWLWNQVKSWMGSLWSGIKSFFGISSPSKLMADTVGKHIVTGLAKGILDNRGTAAAAMAQLAADVAGVSFATPGVHFGANGRPSGSGRSASLATVAASVASSGRGGQVVVNHYHIAGTVIAERDLLNLVQVQGYRFGARNKQTWQNYKRR